MEVTEAIRNQIDELRREKAMRFDSLILDLQTEIRSKNTQMKDTWRQFEEAVVAYEKLSSISADIPESVDEDEDENEGPLLRERSASKIASDDEDDYYEKSGLSIQDLEAAGYEYSMPQPKSTEPSDSYNNNYMDKSLVDRSRSATTEGESPQSTLPFPTSAGTYTAATVVIPEKKPAVTENKRTSMSSIASSKALLHDGPKRKAQAKCKRLQYIVKALEASIAESQYKLVYTREDYQRSLQALDDLEDDLCSISTRFEENEKMSLGHFFTALQTKQDQSIVEVYKDLKEYKTRNNDQIHRGQKRKRPVDQDVTLLSIGEEDELPLAKVSRTEAKGKPVLKTLLAVGTLTAIAAATGYANGYLPASL
ncbi:hypothetical protein K450DRAFT_254490 [Umbelopsis ramanniana AG]|uniref:Uncharacterized protein n=1 Tax=Umbelopsis ramanniana AG TaxID=1314678 RepID=A0AAD5HBM0_UMBRA|nr:uncharacterized protein K450DRAFT_254490 [Umbelopsis ramanniana AG]KAI8576974.1 hypothetical protein K450DRAFT_254490 [Umbelopsis ramanniana AG]